jgi:hypothetical protein
MMMKILMKILITQSIIEKEIIHFKTFLNIQRATIIEITPLHMTLKIRAILTLNPIMMMKRNQMNTTLRVTLVAIMIIASEEESINTKIETKANSKSIKSR